MILPAAVQRLNAAYRGRARNEAYVEFAQEHFLDWLRTEGLLANDAIVFKGGTSLRKFFFGIHGRFSRDLDFGITDRATGEYVIEAVQAGFAHEGVVFRPSGRIDMQAMKGAWVAEAEGMGEPSIPSSLDFSTRELLLPPIHMARADLPGLSRDLLGFTPVTMALADPRETVAEKLARFRRVIFGRDLYDLAQIVRTVRDDLPLIREMLFYKVYFDVVDNGRGTAPFRVSAEYRGHSSADVIDADELGALTGRAVDVGAMLKLVQGIFGNMVEPTSSEPELTATAACNVGQRWQVAGWMHELRDRLRLTPSSLPVLHRNPEGVSDPF